MKLRNKRTGEIVDFAKGNFISSKDYGFVIYKDGGRGIDYHSLAEFNEEWEDYKELKGMQWVDVLGANDGRVVIQYFNEEEAERVVEKLKAWKRLKDKGFKFVGNGVGLHTLRYTYEGEWCLIVEDFNLLFGGEE